jgi:hypothetical protein
MPQASATRLLQHCRRERARHRWGCVPIVLLV